MKFQCNTKPLSDALNLGIINSNVSNFHKKSTLTQITATKNLLKINVEASRICSEMLLRGMGDSDEPAKIFVNSLLLKQLVSTFDSNTVELEFSDSGLVFHSGKSTFTLPKMVDDDELELMHPEGVVNSPELDIDKSNWKFIKDYQMYAIAMSFIHPVYTYVWVGSSGDVLVGDFDNSLFTLSHKGVLDSTCLLSETIINLFNSLPDGSKISKSGSSYIIRYDSDSFSYRTQFMPKYETDEDTGTYNSDIFLGMMAHPYGGVSIKAEALAKNLNQALLLSSSTEDTVALSARGSEFKLTNTNVNCDIPFVGNLDSDYSVSFKLESLKQVISNYGDSEIHVNPLIQEGECAGIIVWNDELTTVLAGVE